jgi:hypothetical protein
VIAKVIRIGKRRKDTRTKEKKKVKDITLAQPLE